ncbi:MAG: lysophospholipid acyltransferase family protein [Myxococcota bacterium]
MRIPFRSGVRARVDRIEIPFDELELDPFGARKDDIAAMMSFLEPFYRRYFRVRVEGMAHVPARGRAMLVGNHSGGWAVDGMMVVASCFFEMEPPRLVHGMAERFLYRIPFVASLGARTGNFVGLPENAERLLEADRLLMVFPEGARGTAKLFWERNSLLEFGTGFARLALKTGTPVVPFAFVGGGEAIPTIANLYRLGRRLGVPYIPVTPYGVALPRPVPLEIYYGEPVLLDGTGDEEDSVIHRYVDTVKKRIRDLLDHGESKRRFR